MSSRIHTVSLRKTRNGIAGRRNGTCKGGMAMRSVAGERILLPCGGSIRAGAEIMSGGHTELSMWFFIQWGKGLSVLKQGFSVIIPVITRGPGIGEKVSSEWSYLGRSKETWARLQSSGELKSYYPSCILWTSVALAFMQGLFCLAENTCKYLESQPEGRATDIKRVEVRDAAKHQTMYKTVPHDKGLSGPKISMVPMLRNPIWHAAIWLQLAGFCLTITIPFWST